MRIRKYRQADAASVGRLICETYRTYNLSHADLDEQDRLLGPFKHAFSDDVEHQRAIRMVIHSPVVYVADIDGEVVGVLRGRDDVIASLFVAGNHHRKGIGRRLVARFESDCRRRDVSRVRVAATIFAVPFYQSLGYKKTTGIRPCRSFDGTDLTYQPMTKNLA
ncbi:MAG: GNAT family N-acetyltransferase [Planctomycetota bacterium]|jgi:putative acetyltransferase